MITALERDGMVEGWEDLKDLVYHIIHKHLSRHEGNFEDCLHIAQQSFFYSWERYDPEKGSISNFVAFNLRCDLMQILRDKKRDAGREQRHVEYLETHTRSAFDPREFAAELSKDASQVIDMLCNCPGDLAAVLQIDKRPGPATKGRLKNFLEGMGWSTNRVAFAFLEIEQAL